jgi:hypothetical protein
MESRTFNRFKRTAVVEEEEEEEEAEEAEEVGYWCPVLVLGE